jgi:hypothetical protein
VRRKFRCHLGHAGVFHQEGFACATPRGRANASNESGQAENIDLAAMESGATRGSFRN